MFPPGTPPGQNLPMLLEIDLNRRLQQLAQRAGRGKRRGAQVARLLLDCERACAELASELLEKQYRPRPGRSFWICDPKRRCIYALPFRDRVVQHLLIEETLPAIESRLLAQSYACRAGKGTHRCLRRAAELHRHHGYVLRVDLQRFFPSLDHGLLRQALDRVVAPEWRWLRDRFLDSPVVTERADFHFAGEDSFTPTLRPHGLPIGSLTSQIWANYYLSPLDHTLASFLGLGSFVRYSDDLLVYDDDAERLRRALGVLHRKAEALRLRLHPDKTGVRPTTERLPFLGFELQRRGDGVRVRLQQDNLLRMRQRVRALRALYQVGALLPEEVTARLRAWLAHARHGHTRSLVERELQRWRFQREEDE